jgi:hypothetical protein
MPPLIKPGEYQVIYLRHETLQIFKTPKVIVHFRITEFGDAFGKGLFRAYRVKRLNSRPRRGGGYTIGCRSDLCYTLCSLFPDEPRPTKINLKRLAPLILRARVRTVTSDYRQRKLPLPMQYSVVDDLLGIEAGASYQEPTT